MTSTLPGADIRGFYTALGIDIPRWAGQEASVRCFADAEAHQHGDRSPSTSINTNNGAWKCHGCGAYGGAYDAAVARGHDPRSAIELMIRYGITRRRPPRTDSQSLRRRHGAGAPPARARRTPSTPPSLAISESQLRRWHLNLVERTDVLERLATRRGWTLNAIRQLQLGLDGEDITIPVRDAHGDLVSLLRYRPGGHPKIRAARGSRRALLPHPAAEPSEQLLLVEGEPDAIASRSRNLPAIAIPGAETWQTRWAPLFAGRHVTIALDADTSGRVCAHRIAHDLAPHSAEVRVIDLAPEREDGYDLTGWLHEHPGPTSQILDQLRQLPAVPRS